jgi:beta-lactamase regulating signal transducer with metallopeptidase domain
MISHRFFDLAVWQLAQVTVAIAAVGLVTRIFCRRRPALAYALWLLVLVKSLTPPIWNSPTGIFSWAASRQSVAVVAGRVEIPSAPMVHLSAAQAILPAVMANSDSWQAWRLVLAVWACGCGGMLLVIAIRSRLLAKRIARSSVAPPAGLAEILESTCQSLGLKRRPALGVCREAIGPAVLGIFRPTLVIPATIAAANNVRQLRTIVVHELVHLRRRDLPAAGVQLLGQAVWWFHPLVWWMNRQINQTREMICDAQAIANLQCPPADYAQALIDVLRLRRIFELVPLSLGIASTQVTARRLDHIMNNAGVSQRISWRNWGLIAALALLLLPGAGVWSSGAAADQVDAPPAQPNKVLYDFLGQPVAPPADLNEAYTKEGLADAAQMAARKAGIGLRKVEIDDSEFPFLVGVITEGNCEKLNDAIGKMAGYAYGGSVSGDEVVKVMNIIPYGVFPKKDHDRIDRRLTVRMQMLYYKLLAESVADKKGSPDRGATTEPASEPAGE